MISFSIVYVVSLTHLSGQSIPATSNTFQNTQKIAESRNKTVSNLRMRAIRVVSKSCRAGLILNSISQARENK